MKGTLKSLKLEDGKYRVSLENREGKEKGEKGGAINSNIEWEVLRPYMVLYGLRPVKPESEGQIKIVEEKLKGKEISLSKPLTRAEIRRKRRENGMKITMNVALEPDVADLEAPTKDAVHDTEKDALDIYKELAHLKDPNGEDYFSEVSTAGKTNLIMTYNEVMGGKKRSGKHEKKKKAQEKADNAPPEPEKVKKYESESERVEDAMDAVKELDWVLKITEVKVD